MAGQAEPGVPVNVRVGGQVGRLSALCMTGRPTRRRGRPWSVGADGLRSREHEWCRRSRLRLPGRLQPAGGRGQRCRTPARRRTAHQGRGVRPRLPERDRRTAARTGSGRPGPQRHVRRARRWATPGSVDAPQCEVRPGGPGVDDESRGRCPGCGGREGRRRGADRQQCARGDGHEAMASVHDAVARLANVLKCDRPPYRPSGASGGRVIGDTAGHITGGSHPGRHGGGAAGATRAPGGRGGVRPWRPPPA